MVSPAHRQTSGPRRRQAWVVLRAGGVPHPLALTFHLLVSCHRLQPRLKQAQLAKRLRALSEAASTRYGYRRIAALLRQEGWSHGQAAQVQRLRRADGLRVPPTQTQDRASGGLHRAAHQSHARRGHVWTWDFVSDATVRGGALKMLTILDEFTRECHVLRPDRALRAADVLAWLERAIKTHGAPAFLRSDNGPEFIAKEVQRWLADQPASKPSTSIRAVPGRMASSRASMAASVTSASTRKCFGRSPRHA